MLSKFPEISLEIYKYSHFAFSETSYLLYGDWVIKSCEGSQHGDPKAPAVFSDTIQELVDY